MLKIAIAAAALVIAPAAFAQSNTIQKTPGHEMQLKGSKKGSPGASGYAPGHEMQQKKSNLRGPGASGFAPGHQGQQGR
jgi:opacity protein-like surface antigen